MDKHVNLHRNFTNSYDLFDSSLICFDFSGQTPYFRYMIQSCDLQQVLL